MNDSYDRMQAVTTFDRNVVVTAGAGTGKTTLLVDRIVHLIMREPHPLRITDLAALTFTRKAAAEMRVRLRDQLQAYVDLSPDRSPANALQEKSARDVEDLMGRYRLTKDQIDQRAQEALRHLERCEIGTLHSFAGTLLRLYPVEARLDPKFSEDAGSAFEHYVEEEWKVWLDRELSADPPRRELWRQLLNRITLSDLESLARALCSEVLPMTTLEEGRSEKVFPQPVLEWISKMKERGEGLLSKYPKETKIRKSLQTAWNLFDWILSEGVRFQDRVDDLSREILSGDASPYQPVDWDPSEFAQAAGMVRAAGLFLEENHDTTSRVFEALIPFVSKVRQGFLNSGWISFDSLLIRARDLLRDHPAVREELKQKFKSILVDEFQDTDPIQYEILLYLAEEPGRQARRWQEIRLSRGKMFVVGDPKQSIYAFRRADMEAYLRVVQEVIEKQDGLHFTLRANFRSHGKILDVVNGIFERLIRPKEGLQPDYHPIHPSEPLAETLAETLAGPEGPSPREGRVDLPYRGVRLRRVRCPDESIPSDLARRLEGESLARWLSEEVIGKAVIREKTGETVRVEPRHIAVLMRSLTSVEDYLEPLRKRGIRYVVEGEKRFYAVQEIIDAVNLLKIIDNPYDTTALVGVLRSSLGGLTDARIYRLHQEGLLDYRCVRRRQSTGEMPVEAPWPLYRVLDRLHREAPKLPVGEAVSKILEETPLIFLSARGRHGEQAVANLEKIRRLAAELGREGGFTLKEVIFRLTRHVDEVTEEGESALAEEAADAVKVLSIHKAKGLEFPMVILAGCHRGRNSGDPGKRARVLQDWSTALIGLQTPDFRNASAVLLSQKEKLRELEEERRVLYVAMTRAREHLTISCAPTGRRGNGSFLSLIEEAVGEIPSEDGLHELPVGEGAMVCQVVTENLPSLEGARLLQPSPPVHPFDEAAYAASWKGRLARYQEILAQPRFVSPTLLSSLPTHGVPVAGDLLRYDPLQRKDAMGARPRVDNATGHGEGQGEGGVGKKSGGRPEEALFIGDLAHRFLKEWDFASDPSKGEEVLSGFLQRLGSEDAKSEQIQKELRKIFHSFFQSDLWLKLSDAKILGREVPLLYAQDGRIVEGVIDLLYEQAGRLYVSDYKTDRIVPDDPAALQKTYGHQARIYTEAVRRTFQRDPTFQLIFLRAGKAVEVAV